MTLSLSAFLVGFDIEKSLDDQLRQKIADNGLDAPFVADLAYDPAQEPLADLGGELFFSPDLSIDGSVACATCHHPNKGGSDGLALPVGIGGLESTLIGDQRLTAARGANPDVVFEGLVPRNAPTVFNAALFRENLFWDGRVQYRTNDKGERIIKAGVFGAGQENPSNYLQKNLLQTQARMPMSSTFEMKGGLKPQLNNHEIEQDILFFLQSKARWCQAFAAVYGEQPCDELITLNHLTEALSTFEASLVFTDSPFERYVRGDSKALTVQQKRGALLFMQSKAEGGAGCASCHRGKVFTNEQFYNLNIPPNGRGANDNGWDLGRNNVDKIAERFSFRVPGLLNVALTAPYFHNGVAADLESVIRHKVTAASRRDVPANAVPVDNVAYAPVREAVADAFASSRARALLPDLLSDEQIAELVAFLNSLTDDCLADSACRQGIVRKTVASPRQKKQASRAKPQPPRVKSATLAVPKVHCAETQRDPAEEAGFFFSRHDGGMGLDHQRSVGMIKKGWLLDVVNYASVAAMDVDYDCLDDLLFDAGEKGYAFYRQQPDGRFKREPLAYRKPVGGVNALLLDLDGDYRFDLFTGNLGQGSASFVFDFLHSADDVMVMQQLTGPVINATVADINNDGYLDMAFALWRSFNSLRQEHLWLNDGAGNLSANESYLPLRQDKRRLGYGESVKRITPASAGAPDLTFTPNFVDVDHDGDQDLLLAADFSRSQVLINDNGRFRDVTDKTVINDSNGMGAAIADYNSDGEPDWFVTSIVDKRTPAMDGHKLYISAGEGRFIQQKIINKETEWSWGACAADFNNDGHQDIFYISGYAEDMPSARYESDAQKAATDKFLELERRFAQTTPTLLINDGKGDFVDQSKAWGFDQVLDGRGIACFDYQQDGDIDIVVAQIDGAPVLFKNHVNGRNKSLGIRLIGLPGNTEAFGTRMTLFGKTGRQHRQLRFENNFVSRNPSQLHFGLGADGQYEKLLIELPPPLNKKVELRGLQSDRLHVLQVNSF